MKRLPWRTLAAPSRPSNAISPHQGNRAKLNQRGVAGADRRVIAISRPLRRSGFARQARDQVVVRASIGGKILVGVIARGRPIALRVAASAVLDIL